MEVAKRYTSDPSWEREIEEFAEAIVNNEKITNGSAEEALHTMELVYRIYCADKKWKKLYKLSDEVPNLSEV